MTELLFNIFGDATRHVTNTPAVYKHTKNNDENIGIARNVGKGALDGPIKPQEAPKKSFLCNAGKPLQSTPVHQKTKQVFAAPTPIYSDVDSQQDWFEELKFTPLHRLDNFHIDIFEDSFDIGVESPQHSPLPKTKDASMEFQNSFEDDFLTDKQLDMDLVLEDDLPELY